MSALFLKIKLKSLAAEARIIKQEQEKAKQKARLPGDRRMYWAAMREKLDVHRRQIVRPEARETHIAYGFLRGLTYRQMERDPKTSPKWGDIRKMVERYGGREAAERLEDWATTP